MKFLASAIKDASTPKLTIISSIRKSFAAPLPERSHKTIHASDLTKEHFCPREIALMDLLNLTRKPRHFETAMKVTFDMGELTAKAFNERWMVKQVYGDWKCIRCNQLREFCRRPPEILEGSDCEHLWEYKEVRFHDPRYDYSGGLDSILDLNGQKLHIIELKTISADEFKKLAAPLSEHRVRTNLYLNLVEHSNHPQKHRINTKTAKVFYVSRGYGLKHESGETLPFKEFDIERNDADLTTPLSRALIVKRWREEKKMPAPVCTVSYCPQAKSCPLVQPCFSGKYPAHPSCVSETAAL